MTYNNIKDSMKESNLGRRNDKLEQKIHLVYSKMIEDTEYTRKVETRVCVSDASSNKNQRTEDNPGNDWSRPFQVDHNRGNGTCSCNGGHRKKMCKTCKKLASRQFLSTHPSFLNTDLFSNHFWNVWWYAPSNTVLTCSRMPSLRYLIMARSDQMESIASLAHRAADLQELPTVWFLFQCKEQETSLETITDENRFLKGRLIVVEEEKAKLKTELQELQR